MNLTKSFLKKAYTLSGKVLCLLAVFYTNVLCGQDFNINDKVPIPMPGMNSQRSEEMNEANFVEGMKYYIIEEYDRALEQFNQILKKNDTNAGLLYQVAATYSKLKNKPKAIEYAQKAYQIEPGNAKYAQLAAGLLANEGNYAAAADIYKKMFEANTENVELGLDLAAAYYSLGEYDKVQKVYAVIEKNMGVSAELTRHKQGIYLKMNKVNDAIKEGEKLIAAEPNDAEHYIEQAELLLKFDKVTEAQGYIDKALNLNPENGQGHIMKADIARQKKDFDTMYAELNLAFKDKQMDDDIMAKVIYSFFEDLPKEAAGPQKETLIKNLIEKQPNLPYGYLLLGDYNFGLDKKAEARESYLKALKFDKSNNQLWGRILGLSNELSLYKETNKLAEEAIELYPNEALFWYYGGVASFMNKKHEEAIEQLEEAKRLNIDNKDFAIMINSVLAESYNRVGKYEDSDEAFEAVLKEQPKNDGVINNYAYYLALRKENLDKAIALMEPVLERNPKNATYLDTIGWLYFVNKNYRKALELLEKAFENSDKSSATIADHLGDAYYKNAAADKAMEFWKKAAVLSPNNKDIAKKISDGKLIE